MYTDPTGTGGGVQQPQASATVQPRLDVCPQVLTFSTDMSYEQLSVWLINHSQLVGVGYQQDISKLKGIITQIVVKQYHISNNGHFLNIRCQN